MISLIIHAEAEKCIEKLNKKYRYFNSDFERWKLQLTDENQFETQIRRPSDRCSGTECDKTIFYKARKFRSQDLQKSDKFRLIYFLKDKELHLIDIYCKNDRENEDRSLYKKYCGQ